ncbi:hypothetical protein TrVE_jg11754 [Triparma verrucosa]|uniref:Uncharacterized protein n=1 Tax=Triparma verrucosa TaxID=1606542 RepID=A0A9W7CKF8_9STRA|nr:hypothetical protein TrVE_jg11754 [Triparma verrucosa]
MTEGAQPRRMSAAEIFQASQDGGNKVGSMKKKQDNGITGVLAIEESGAKVESLGGRRVLVRNPHGGTGMSNVFSDNSNVLPPPPPKPKTDADPTKNEYGDFDPDRREKAKRIAMQKRFDALAKPKARGRDIYDDTQTAKKGTTYLNGESEDNVVWGGGPAPKVPPEVGRRLSQGIIKSSTSSKKGKAVSLADLLAVSRNVEGDPKPRWNSEFTDAESLRLENIGSINDEDPPSPQQAYGDKKAVANFMKFQGARRASASGPGQGQDRIVKLNKGAPGGRISPDQRGSLTDEFYEKAASPIAAPKKLSIADYMKATGQEVKKVEKPIAVVGSSTAKKKTISMMDYLKKGGIDTPSGVSTPVEDSDSDADQQKALWAKFGMKQSTN